MISSIIRNFKNKKNKNALSPIISAVLLLVIGVILVVILLSWGKDFTNKSTSTVSNIYKKSDTDFIVAKSTGTPQNYNTLLVKNITPTSQATNNENQENLEYVKYKILDPTTRYHLINNDEFEIDPPLTLPPGQEIPFNLFCTPSSKFTVQLISRDNTYSDITYQNPNFNPLSCAIREVSLGNDHTCALLNDGKVKCWGRNNSGQLGNGSSDSYSLLPVEVSNIDNAISIASGGAHICALLDNGKVKCWGYNRQGQLGDGTTKNKYTPVDVVGIDNAVSITAGGNHTCVILEDGTVKCWGRNDVGQLGNENVTNNSSTPIDVLDISNVVSISSSGEGHHTCVLLEDGNVKCWGYNGYGQLGNDSNISTPNPVDVLNISNVVYLSSGGQHTCAILEDDTIKCWGYNRQGQLGDDTNVNRATPVEVFGIDNAVSVLSSNYGHTCAILRDNTIKCWGLNNYGQLGNGSEENSFRPVDVLNISNAVSMHLGFAHTCAVLSDGKIKCWGVNGYGMLGIDASGGGEIHSIPIEVSSSLYD